MKYRKWEPKVKARIILESLENGIPLTELCNKYKISQSQYYHWFNEFQTKVHKVFESDKLSTSEKRLLEENKNLKRIIAELSIEIKNSEFGLDEEKAN
jgi:transposase-like protein